MTLEQPMTLIKVSTDVRYAADTPMDEWHLGFANRVAAAMNERTKFIDTEGGRFFRLHVNARGDEVRLALDFEAPRFDVRYVSYVARWAVDADQHLAEYAAVGMMTEAIFAYDTQAEFAPHLDLRPGDRLTAMSALAQQREVGALERIPERLGGDSIWGPHRMVAELVEMHRGAGW